MTRPPLLPAAARVTAAPLLVLVLVLVAVVAPLPGAAAGPVSLGDCPGGPPAIAVDVGHGRAEPGAISAHGKPEFAFNLPLAHAVSAALARAGAWPKLINDEGATLALAERVRRIAETAPTLVLSIHHDSVQPQYLERWTYQGRSLDYSDRFSGFSLFVSGRNPAAKDSERLARLIGQALIGQGLAPSLHHAEAIAGENRPLLDPVRGVYAYDGLAVLKGSRVPAVLIEAGIIKNRADAETLDSPRFRVRFADAVVAAIARWCRGEAVPPG